jgi:hypothetical protein
LVARVFCLSGPKGQTDREAQYEQQEEISYPHIFTLWYFSYVVGERPDVVVLNGTLLGYSWYRDNVRLLHPQVSIPNSGAGGVAHLIESNRAHYPIYLTDYEPGSLARYSFSPRGPLYQLEE